MTQQTEQQAGLSEQQAKAVHEFFDWLLFRLGDDKEIIREVLGAIEECLEKHYDGDDPTLPQSPVGSVLGSLVVLEYRHGLVGRRAADPSPTRVLISGAPGIGKTKTAFSARTVAKIMRGAFDEATEKGGGR